MKKPALNDEQFMLEASQVADLYHQLTLDLFDQVVERIKERGPQSLDDNPYLWQAEKLQQMGLLNDENVKMIAERSGIAEEQLRNVLENEGLKIYEDTRQQIMEATGKKGLVTDNSHIQTVLSTYVNQAMFDIDNLINTTLPKSVIGAYQGIVEESVAKVVTGLATHDQAINQTVMKWFEKGFYGFTDKGGKRWKADNYARTIIKSTAYRVKNEMRMRPAEELGIDTFYYSMKAAAREMCAPLQHQIVTTGNARTEKGIKIYALSDYGYGSPGGCQGINCGHTMTPFIPGVNRIPELNDELKDITPEKAIENANIQSKQRALEREIRHAKEQLHLANQLDDKELIDKYSAKVRSHQATMRAYIKKNPFLHRDYAREKIFEPEDVPYLKIKHKILMNKIDGSVSEKQFWEHEGKKYYVDGKNVVLDYTKEEKDVAEWLAKKFGGHIELVPRVNYPKGISTPDYLINNIIKFDLKEITGSGKNVIDNNLKKSKKQSSNFIFDVTNAHISEQELYRQIYNVYKSKRRNVDVIILKDGENVLDIIKKR